MFWYNPLLSKDGRCSNEGRCGCRNIILRFPLSDVLSISIKSFQIKNKGLLMHIEAERSEKLRIFLAYIESEKVNMTESY